MYLLSISRSFCCLNSIDVVSFKIHSDSVWGVKIRYNRSRLHITGEDESLVHGISKLSCLIIPSLSLKGKLNYWNISDFIFRSLREILPFQILTESFWESTFSIYRPNIDFRRFSINPSNIFILYKNNLYK